MIPLSISRNLPSDIIPALGEVNDIFKALLVAPFEFCIDSHRAKRSIIALP